MSPEKKALTLTIPEPCGEDFNAMTPVKGGKFCGSCEKTIVDFRTMNDYQILQFYKQNNGKICGVFNYRQLNRAMPFPLERKPSRNWKAVAALATGLLFGGGLVGQTTAPTVGKIAVATHTTNKPVKVEASTTPEKIISGVVKDQALGEALIGANIIIVGTTLGTSTDIDGHFELSIPANLVAFELTITYTGFDSQTLLFNDKYPIPNHSIEVTLGTFEQPMIMGIMIAPDFEEAPTCGTDEIVELEDIPEITPDVVVEKEIVVDQQMTVFPNPFVHNLKVSYDFAAKGAYLFNVYDMNGRLLFAKSYILSKGEQTVELEMATKNLNHGVYILQLSDSQDRVLVTKKIYKGQA